MEKNKILGIMLCLLGLTIIVGTFIISNSSYALPDKTGITVRFYNLDENDNEISSKTDSKFVLVDNQNKPVKYFSLGINKGYIEFSDLNAGIYTLKNYESPDNYEIGKDMEINIQDMVDVQEFQYINKKSDNQKVLIYVRDVSTNAFVKGNVIELKNEQNEVVDKCTTNDLIPCIFQNLENGKYFVKEVNISDGYIESEEDKSFEVSDENIGKTIIVDYKKEFTKVGIKAIDANTSQQLIGAKFEVYDSTGNKISDFTSTEETYILERLPIGKYTIKEIEAPNGYLLKANEQTIEVKNSKEIINVTFTNNPIVNKNEDSKNFIYFSIGIMLFISGLMIIFFIYKKRHKSIKKRKYYK